MCTLPCGGGVASGSSVRYGRENPVTSPGPVGPFEEEPRIRRGGLRYFFLEEVGATCGSYPRGLPRLAGGELLVLCEAAVVGVEGGAVTLGWGRNARVHGHSVPCPNIPPRWPFLVCGRGVAGGAGPCF